MKIPISAYGQLLYEMTNDASDKALSSALKDFVDLCAHKGVISQMDGIIRSFVQYYHKQEGIVEVAVTTARKLNQDMESQVHTLLQKVLPNKTLQITYTHNPELLGGITVRYADKILDGSIMTRLEQLKQELFS